MDESKKELYTKLQTAVELELATIPPYLTAVFSIHRDANRVSASLIRSVYMEEMLHLVLAGNLMTATGGGAKLGRSNIPVYPLRLEFEGKEFEDREFDVELARFSKETIDIFRQIELPEWAKPQPEVAVLGFKIDGFSIGDFYESIRKELADLCKAIGEDKVFTGKLKHQISEDYYWGAGGKPLVVTDMESASKAIDQIVEQGEGAGGSFFDGDVQFGQPEEMAHYFRFNEIYHERHYKLDDEVKKPPTGDPLAVDWEAVYPIKPNCKHADFKSSPELSALNREFNYKYSLMLSQLEEGFNGNPKAFYTAIMDGMHDLGPLAFKMVELPIKGDPENRHGAPSFEWEDSL